MYIVFDEVLLALNMSLPELFQSWFHFEITTCDRLEGGLYILTLLLAGPYTVVPLWYDLHTAKEPKSHQRGSRISEGWKNVKWAEFDV